jgi:small subunit ribosomal protein S16
VGSRKNPIWRVVVADQRSPRDGRVIETIGRYNAQTEPSEIVIDRERLDHWLARGAQPTGTVKKLMRAAGPPATGVASGSAPAEPTERSEPVQDEPPADAATGDETRAPGDAAPEAPADEVAVPPEGEAPARES